MIIVLVILGLVVGIAASRGPQRSHGLEVRGFVAALVEALRGARGRAIAGNRPVLVEFNVEGHSVSFGGGPTIPQPQQVALAAYEGPAGVPKQTKMDIRFAPDGSSSGGRILLADGERPTHVGIVPGDGRRHTQISIDWLTGRVSVADVP